MPYLFEEEGTDCENLPATHEFLKRVRAEVDQLYPDRVLLAEATSGLATSSTTSETLSKATSATWPFHFGDATDLHGGSQGIALSISEIMAQTPEIPANCQWGIFLRNHDELTLGDG